jgi:DNA invertase Pin-like site-specific DNA recombinase
MGSFIFHITAALAELERSIIRERTRAGLASARARGRKGGRPKKLNDREWRAKIVPWKVVCDKLHGIESHMNAPRTVDAAFKECLKEN